MKKEELKKLIKEQIDMKKKQDFLKYTTENFTELQRELDKIKILMREDGYDVK